jgi:hypothetical protein
MTNNTQIKQLNIYDLPQELIEIIYYYFKSIRDIETQKSLRLVCKSFYNMFPQIKEYNINNKLVKTHHFSNEKYKTVLDCGFITRQIVFEPFGKYKFVEYNSKNLCKIIINNPPYEVIMYEKTKSSVMIKKKTNISSRNNTTEITYTQGNINVYNPFPNLNISRLYPFNNANAPMCIIS